MAETVGVALFGTGRAGTIHLVNLVRNERASVLYVIERDLSKASELATKYKLKDTKVLAPESSAEVYQDERVAAVLVCTPTFEHEEIVRTALKHGKAVFCEKPVSRDVAGISACYEEAEKAGKPLFCAFNRRFDPSLRSVRERTHAGEVGAVHVVKSCSRDSSAPPASYLQAAGKIFNDSAIHDIDMICWIVGDYPLSVYAVAHAHIDYIRDLDDVDTLIISMKFPGGTLATIDMSRYAAYGYDQRLEVFGSKGMLVSENQRPTEVMSLTASGTTKDRILDYFPQRYADSYIGALHHFLNAVEGKEELSVTKRQTVNATVVAAACEQSYRTGQPVRPDYV